MKKLILTLGAMVMATGAFAQGYISLGNTAATAFSTNSATWSASGGVTALGGAASGSTSGTYDFALLTLTGAYNGGALTTDTNVWDGTWQFTGIQTGNKLNGQPGVVTAASGVQTLNMSSSQTQQVIVVGWSSSLASTWLQISNMAASGFAGNSTAGYFGVSQVGFIEAATSAGPFPSVWFATAQTYGTPIATGFEMFSVPTGSVPEPATLALAGLGGLSLILFRRQRK